MWRSREFNFLVIVVVAVAVHIAIYASRLPETVPTHFGASGEADGWASRGTALGFYAGMVAFIVALSVGIAAGMRRMPAWWFNCPNRDYWLSGPREAATREYFARSMFWIGGLTVLFIGVIEHLSFESALSGSGRLGAAFWIALGAFMLYTTVWSIRLVLRFSKIPPGEN